jgi:hypothetical protein
MSGGDLCHHAPEQHAREVTSQGRAGVDVARRVEICVERSAHLGGDIGLRATTHKHGFGARSTDRNRADAAEGETRTLDDTTLDAAVGGQADQRVVPVTAGQLSET